MKEIADASMQATESTVDVTPPQAATKIMAGMADGMAVWQMEWLNGGNGGNGQMAERMAEWRSHPRISQVHLHVYSIHQKLIKPSWVVWKSSHQR
jgi:hypothetical protein